LSPSRRLIISSVAGMFTTQGISLDTWAGLTAECTMSAEVVGDQAQLQFGHGSGSLSLVTNEPGLAKLLRLVTDVWTRWQAAANGDRIAFAVPDENQTSKR